MAGLDRDRAEQEDWNPLGEFISKRGSVFVLCNFVYHRRPNESETDFFSKCTHGSVVRAVVDYVYIAVGREGAIQFGNAPLQSCDWDKVLKDTGADKVEKFYKSNKLPLNAKDLRLFVATRDMLGRINDSVVNESTDAIEVSLDQDSLLEALYSTDSSSGKSVKFRVSDYNPEMTESCHGKGRHKYIINKKILEADTIVSVPKLKTHEKVGITVGLKGMVGCVGRKECLAHHRFGPPSIDGDEYPENSMFRIQLSRLHDFVYSRRYSTTFVSFLEVVDKTLQRLLRRLMGRVQSGAWCGNDTAWRMTLDLARIMIFSDSKGKISPVGLRRHISLVDGVIGGEGEGPLSPKAVKSGVIVFCDNLVLGDLIACKIMGFSSNAIPLIREALKLDDVCPPRVQEERIMVDGRSRRLSDLPLVAGRPFRSSRGWEKALS